MVGRMKFIDQFFETPNLKTSSFRTDIGMISQVLPYLTYDSQSKFYYNEHSIAFLLEINPLLGCDDSMVSILTNMICDGLPEGATVQFINFARYNVDQQIQTWQKNRFETGGIYKKIAERRIKYLAKANFSSLFKTVPFVVRDYRILAAVSLQLGRKRHHRLTKELQTIRNNFVSALKSIGAFSYDLSPVGLINYSHEILNIGSPIKHRSYRKLDLIKDQIPEAESLIEVKDNHLKIGHGYYAKSLTPIHFPEIWHQAENSELLGNFFNLYKQITCPFIISFSFYVTDQVKAKTKAAYKVKRSEQIAKSNLGSLFPGASRNLTDWRFVNDKLAQGQKLVKSIYHIALFTDDYEKLEDSERQIKSIYQSSGFTLTTEKFVQLKNFLACLPMLPGDGLINDFEKIGKTTTHVSWTCSNLLPLQGDFKGNDISYRGMLLMSRRGQIFSWDPFLNHLGNYKLAVIGRSGSGKSFFMQELVTALRGYGGRVYIFDDGRSFEKSCKMQGGSFVEFKSRNKMVLNPFSIIDEKRIINDTDYRDDIFILLNGIFKQMARQEGKCSDFEAGAIAKAVRLAWQEHGRKANVTIVARYLEKNQDSRIRDLATMLFPFSKEGAYGDYFDGETTLALNNDLMAFELSDIKSRRELQRIVMMVLMFIVSESMYKSDRRQRTSFIIDEAWSLLSGSAMTEFVEGLARRARKYNGNLITGTQSMNDYYNNPAATAAIDNTDWICFLSQKPESIAVLKEKKRIPVSDHVEKTLADLK